MNPSALVPAVALAALAAGCGGGAGHDVGQMERDIRRDFNSQSAVDGIRATTVDCVEKDGGARCMASLVGQGTAGDHVAIEVTYDESSNEYLWEVTQ